MQDFNNIGWAKYKALEMSANKRLSHHLSALVTYTWSSRRTATTLLNGWDDLPFEDIDSNDRPHRLTIAALWGLPFGPGKAPCAGAAMSAPAASIPARREMVRPRLFSIGRL